MSQKVTLFSQLFSVWKPIIKGVIWIQQIGLLCVFSFSIISLNVVVVILLIKLRKLERLVESISSGFVPYVDYSTESETMYVYLREDADVEDTLFQDSGVIMLRSFDTNEITGLKISL